MTRDINEWQQMCRPLTTLPGELWIARSGGIQQASGPSHTAAPQPQPLPHPGAVHRNIICDQARDILLPRTLIYPTNPQTRTLCRSVTDP